MINARFLLSSCLPGVVVVAVSSSLLAMGTPPQKPTRSASETSSNAVMLKADALYAAPDVGANVLARLDKGARVRLLATQGGWRQVDSAGKTGWVRLLSISADVKSGVGLSDLEALGKTPQGKAVAVAGVRGLDEEMLKTAQYNAAEIQLLDAYAMSRADAEQFAQAAGLQARALPYLDATKQSDETGAASPSKGN